MTTPRRLLVGVVLLVGSVALGLVVAVSLFLNSSRTTVLVGHDAVVRPTMARDAVVQTGPLLPDFRFRDVGPIGVRVTLGKTEVGSIEELVERYAYIAGDPTAEEVLERAGIQRARALVCAVDSDAANVYITLTARALNADLVIVARASNPTSIDTLVREQTLMARVATGLSVSGVGLMLLANLNMVREAHAALTSNRKEIAFYRDLQARREDQALPPR